jgi:hypothetical protein
MKTNIQHYPDTMISNMIKTIQSVIQSGEQQLSKLDETVLSKFIISRRISQQFKNKSTRRIFLTLWFLKSAIFYWIIS